MPELTHIARRRERNETARQASPPPPRHCPVCPAWILASFRHGALVQVELHHRWGDPCHGLVETQPLSDWGWRAPR